jgi:hypothetical protein
MAVKFSQLPPAVGAFHEFFFHIPLHSGNSPLDLYENRPTPKSFCVDFNAVEKYDPGLSDFLLQNGTAAIEAAERAVYMMNLWPPNEKGEMQPLDGLMENFAPAVRFVNLPTNLQTTSSKVRAHMNGQFIALKAFITALPPPFVVDKIGTYRCKKCHLKVRVVRDADDGPLRFCDDCEKFTMEPVVADAQDGEACFTSFRLEDDLVNTIHQDSYAILNGVVQMREDKTRRVKSLYLEVNSIEMKEKRVKIINDLPQDVVDDIDAFDEYPKAASARIPIPAEVRKKVLEKGGYKCAACKVSGNDAPLEIDHIIPVASGAENVNDIRNLQVLCRTCNRAKSASLPFAFAGRKQEAEGYPEFAGDEGQSKLASNSQKDQS